MLKYFGAAGAVAAIGVLTSAIAFADTGTASADSEISAIESRILVDPNLVSSASGGQGNETASEISADQRIVIISEPTAHQSVPAFTPESPETDAISLSSLVAAQPERAQLDAEMQCLAGTVYFESKGESLAGQLAVAEVVLARRESHRWPNSICGVVHQKSQFSFVRGGRIPRINESSNAWRKAVAIAHIAAEKSWESPVNGSYFFHARYVSPGWRLQRVGSVDNHIFYR